MNKIRVVFLGSRPLGRFALDVLRSLSHVDIVGVVTKEPPPKAWWRDDPHGLLPDIQIDHGKLSEIDFDFGVSINYWKMIESPLIAKPKLGFVNLHHSYNLSLRGRNMTSHAIINARSQNRWYHGTSLHYTDDGLDTGPIISASACEITEFDTAWTLFNKVEILGQNLLEEWLPRITIAKAPAAHPEPDHPLSLRLDEAHKFIPDLHSNPLYTYDLVRAFDFNKNYPAAFTLINGHKLELTTNQSIGDEVILEIDNTRKVFAMRKS